MNHITNCLLIVLPWVIVSLLWAPWQQKFDSRPRHLGFAPFWSHRFDTVEGATVDKTTVALVIGLVAILGFGISYVTG